MGHIIALEGIDGSGKTTVAKLLADKLTINGYKAQVMRAPGSTKLGEAMRAVALNKDIPADPIELMMIFGAAARSLMREAEMRTTGILDVVVLDRCYISDLAYRYADGLGFNITYGFVQNYIEPLLSQDRIFYLKVPVEIAEARMKSAGGRGVDRFESRASSYRRQVAAGYDLTKPMNLMTEIDASPTPEEVADNIIVHLRNVLP